MEDSAPVPAQFKCASCGFMIFNRRYPKCERCGTPIPEELKYSADETRAMLSADLALISEQVLDIESPLNRTSYRGLTENEASSLRRMICDSARSLSTLEQLCVAQENEVLQGFLLDPTDNTVCPGCQKPIFTRRHERCESCGQAIPAHARFTPAQRATLDDLDQKQREIRSFRLRLDSAMDRIQQSERYNDDRDDPF